MNEYIIMLNETLLQPILVAVSSALVVAINGYAKKITDSIIEKNNNSNLEKITATTTNIISEIDIIVDAVVMSHMAMANSMRTDDGLTSDQANAVKISAKEVIMKSLPDALTESGGDLMAIVGGQESLATIIDTMIEKHVTNNK